MRIYETVKKYLIASVLMFVVACGLLCFSQFSNASAFADEKPNKYSSLDVSLSGVVINTLDTNVYEKVAFAVYSADDNSLTFYGDSSVPVSGSVYKDKYVNNVYTGIDKTTYDTKNDVPWAYYRETIISVSFDESFSDIKPESMAYWFYGMGNCAVFDLVNVDTSNTLDMSYMFCGDALLGSVDGFGWDTANVENMCEMFNNCVSLESVDISLWNTRSVNNMSYMFSGCNVLNQLNIDGFNTSSAFSLAGMFSGDNLLVDLDFSGWDVSQVEDIHSMFQDCSGLEHIDLSGWDTSAIKNASGMFVGDIALLDISISDTFSAFTLTDEAICPAQIWFDEKAQVVSNNYMVGTTFNGTVFSYPPVQDITEDMFEVNCTDRNYTGGEIEPEVISNLLTPGTDYIVNYNDNIDAGTAIVSVEGCGNYTGEITYTFNILPMDALIICENSSKAYGQSDPDFTGTVVGLSSSDDLGEIEYFRESGENVGSYIISARWQENPNYDITLVEGVFYIDAQEAPVRQKLSSDMFSVDTSYGIYDGENPITKSISSENLVLDKDYNIIYFANDGVGCSTIIIRGCGEYVGLLTYCFSIMNCLEDVGAYATDDNNWYFQNVYDLVFTGIMQPVNDNIFGVGAELSRTQFITLLWRNLAVSEYCEYDQDNAKNETSLPDVADWQYWTGAANWAVSNGIVTGKQLPDGSYEFDPDSPITFEEVVTVLARYVLGVDEAYEWDTSSLYNDNFTDSDAVEDWAAGSMSWAIDSGIVTGNDNGDGTYTIAASENTTRERAAAILCRDGTPIIIYGTASVGTLTGVEAEVAQYLIDLGWEAASIAAVMGNIACESGFNPASDVNMSGSVNYGYEVACGLFQYTSTSYGSGEYWEFKNYCSAHNLDWTSVKVQMDWTFGENQNYGSNWKTRYTDNLCRSGYYASDTGYPRRWDSTPSAFVYETDVDVATFSWMACYEKPANGSYSHLDRRIASAQKYYSELTASSVYTASYSTNSNNIIVQRAYECLNRGVLYVWGGQSWSGMDCSGLVSYCCTGHLGAHEYTTASIINWPRVSDPQPGDICVVHQAGGTQHTGVYIGGGKMIHTNRSGTPPKIADVYDSMIYVRYPGSSY